ncbi:MAG: hypothetical protein ACQERU_13625 [Bacteroidota bacterium]
MKKALKYLLIAVSFWTIISCEKDFTPDRRFIGSWKILTPDNDTIIFKDESNFTRKYFDGVYHTFDYGYDNDSITIQYTGPNMIGVPPTTHFYELKNYELIIDFSNGCYGFDKQIYTLTKLQ